MGADIEVFRAAVGTSPATGGDPSADLVMLLGGQFEATPTDRYDGTDSAYWCFHEAGTELLWIDTVLSSAEIFVQGDAENGYAPYPRQLFAELLNTTTRTESRPPSVSPTGPVSGRAPKWIRYDQDAGNRLRFQFDDSGQIRSVGVSAPA